MFNTEDPRWPVMVSVKLDSRAARFQLGNHAKHLPLYPKQGHARSIGLGVLSLGVIREREVRNQEQKFRPPYWGWSKLRGYSSVASRTLCTRQCWRPGIKRSITTRTEIVFNSENIAIVLTEEWYFVFPIRHHQGFLISPIHHKQFFFLKGTLNEFCKTFHRCKNKYTKQQ